MEEKMISEDELFTVYCVNCNNQEFKFSMNLLVKNGIVYLQCPKCKEDTKVTYRGIDGVIIEKY